MKRGKRFVSFLLALVMVCSLMVNAGAAESQEEIKAYLNYDITVTYNGEAQTMTDAAGNPVYPVSYNGTTYLPVRAVSNMLGVAVDWDGTTQTVLLSKSSGGTSVEINGTNVDDIRASLERIAFTTGTNIDINAAIKALTEIGTYTVAGITIKNTAFIDKTNKAAILNTVYHPSEDAKVMGENHIGYDWAEIDWNNANDGYICVKLSEEFAFFTPCYIRWVNDKGTISTSTFQMSKGDWVKIPLLGGNQEYAIQVAPMVTEFDNPDLTDDELDFIYKHAISARFTAEIADEDTIWTLSHLRVDYENSPNTCAKALELTKSCKTDAEKITAIFNWVSNRQNIKYDTVEANKNIKRDITDKTRNLNPDHILQSKKGVCEHYAVLMAAMLRSLGIPCKVVRGDVITSDGTTAGHAWVAVRPDTGTLNMSALGAGKDYSIPNHVAEKTELTGWIRLDPTNASNKTFTSNDENYTATDCY